MPNKDPLKLAGEALDKAIAKEKQNKAFLSAIGPAIVESLSGAFKGLSERIEGVVRSSMSNVKVEPQITINPEVRVPDIFVPEIRLPAINVPEAKVTVTVPDIKVPDIVMPEEMQVRGWLNIIGWDKGLLTNPLPVQLRDSTGKPVTMFDNLTQIIGGGSSGKADYFTVKGIQNTVGVVTINPDGSPVYSSSSAGAGSSAVSLVNADGTYYNSDNPLPVSATVSAGATFFASDAVLSVNVISPVGQGDAASAVRVVIAGNSDASVSVISVSDIFSTTTTSTVVNPDNRVRVELPAGATGLTDTELRAAHLDVDQVSGSAWSVAVNSGTITAVTSITNSVAVVNLDRDGNPAAAWQVYPTATGLNETNANVLRVVQMTDSLSSVNTVQWGGSAVATGLNENTAGVVKTYQVTSAINSINLVTINGSTPATGLNETTAGVLRTVMMTDSITSVNVVSGALSSSAAVLTRQSNPTAVAADYVPIGADDLGRQITRPIQVRDLIKTAYVSVTNGTETTLLAGVAGSFLDCIMLTGSNNSDAAVSVDIRNVTAGNIVHTLRIPANATAGWAPAVPWPQDATGNNWTVDGPDETGRTLTFSALFSQEV